MDSGNQTPGNQGQQSEINPTVITNAGGFGTGPQLNIGDLVADRFRIVKLLGHGGMGSVYKVEQIFLRQIFALKTLSGQNFPEVAILRFQKEAQAASKLNHPNLVRAHDFGILGTHQPFFVMDLVEGDNLSEYSKKKGTLSIDEVLKIFIPVCFALAYAHSEGIVHRDIKPGNIMLDTSAGALASGEPYVPKVVDFGIAKLTDTEGGNSVNLTRTGEIFGTPLYMSPEQCLGTKIDHRTDIYSLGCVMFEALTGAPPFHGESALGLMMKHQSESAPSLKEASMGREFPETLEAIVAKAMAKEPDHRYQTLLDLAQDLVVLQQNKTGTTGSVTLARTLPSLPKVPKATSTGISVGMVAAIGATCLGVGFAIGLLIFTQQKPVEKIIDKCADTTTAQDERNAFGRKLIVTHEGPLPFPKRTYKFPNELPIGKCWYQKGEQRSPDILARGTVQVPAGSMFGLKLNKNRVLAYPQALRAFGEYDINLLQLEPNEERSEVLEDNTDVIYDVQLAYCSRMKNLHQLAVFSTPVSDVGILALKDSPNLINIDVSDTSVTADALRKLKHYPNFLMANFARIKDGKSLLPDLSTAKGLKILNCNGLDLTNDDLKLLTKTKSLINLHIQSNPKITDEGLLSICDLPLAELHLTGTSVTPKSIPILVAMKTLTLVDLDKKYWKVADILKLKELRKDLSVSGGLVNSKNRVESWDWKSES